MSAWLIIVTGVIYAYIAGEQADRIAELESQVKSYENLGNMMLDELLEKAQEK